MIEVQQVIEQVMPFISLAAIKTKYRRRKGEKGNKVVVAIVVSAASTVLVSLFAGGAGAWLTLYILKNEVSHIKQEIKNGQVNHNELNKRFYNHINGHYRIPRKKNDN